MSRELLAHSDVSFPCLEAVDGADVIQTSASHKAPGWGVGTGHYPAGAQGDGMNLGGERDGGRKGCNSDKLVCILSLQQAKYSKHAQLLKIDHFEGCS